MATAKITITLDESQVAEIRALVAAGAALLMLWSARDELVRPS